MDALNVKANQFFAKIESVIFNGTREEFVSVSRNLQAVCPEDNLRLYYKQSVIDVFYIIFLHFFIF